MNMWHSPIRMVATFRSSRVTKPRSCRSNRSNASRNLRWSSPSATCRTSPRMDAAMNSMESTQLLPSASMLSKSRATWSDAVGWGRRVRVTEGVRRQQSECWVGATVGGNLHPLPPTGHLPTPLPLLLTDTTLLLSPSPINGHLATSVTAALMPC